MAKSKRGLRTLLVNGLLCTALCFLPLLPAQAQTTARDLSAECRWSARPGTFLSNLYDGKYNTQWKSGKNAWLEISAPEGERIYGLYFCFAQTPKAWTVWILGAQGQWDAVYEGDDRFLHVYVPIEGQTTVRISACGTDVLCLTELRAWGEGELPAWVQRWEESPEKADLMVLTAHPDDELIFMGGTIPYYAVQRRKQVLVVCMTGVGPLRSAELLNGLWEAGLRQYPVIGPFADRYCRTLEKAYGFWEKSEVDSFLMKVIRKYRPDVVVTHDAGGEYGHGMHRLCADAVMRLNAATGDPLCYPQFSSAFGTWNICKIYLHLYPLNPIRMDWRMPMLHAAGETPLEAARRAYLRHESQQQSKYRVDDEWVYSCAEFGLWFSSVGEDHLKNDFLENLP